MKQVILALVVCAIIGINGLSEAKCTSRGKFPNNAVVNCKGYTMCLSSAGDSFAEYDLDCPNDFLYSHIDSQCTNNTSYQCLPDYNCTNSGNFGYSNDCTKYVACVEDLDQKITARLITCPENTIYNFDQGTCVNGTIEMCNIIDNEPENINVTEAFPSTNNAPFIGKNMVLSLLTVAWLLNLY